MKKQEEFLKWLLDNISNLDFEKDNAGDYYARRNGIKIRISHGGLEGTKFIQAYRDDLVVSVPTLCDKDYPVVGDIYKAVVDSTQKKKDDEYWSGILKKLQ